MAVDWWPEKLWLDAMEINMIEIIGKNLTMVDIATCKTLKIELFNGSRVMAWEVVSRMEINIMK